MTYEATAEAQIKRLHDEIEKLEELLRHADMMGAWEATHARDGFQEEIEKALGIGRQEKPAVKPRSKIKNPITGTWTKRDYKSPKFMDRKADPKSFAGVRKTRMETAK